MRRLIVAVIVSGGIALTFGCSDSAKKSDPKLSDGKADPRLKPAEAGGAGAPKGGRAVPGD